MARVTVEDCIDKVDSPYELVLVAKERATQLNSGIEPTLERDNDKNTVIALREIADETLSVDSLKDKLIQEYQTVSALDEEELSLDYADSVNEKVEIITKDESQLNEENDEANNLNENELSENDSNSTPINDGYTNISDNNHQN